jgi:hypothetical protein
MITDIIEPITEIKKKRGRKPKAKEIKTTTPIIVIKEIQFINF